MDLFVATCNLFTVFKLWLNTMLSLNVLIIIMESIIIETYKCL